MSEYPAGWQKIEIRNLVVKLVNGGTPDTSVAGYWNGDIPWVTGADFTDKGIGAIRRYVSEHGVRASSTSVVESGNLLVVTRTGVGKLAITKESIAISQDITGVYLDFQKIDLIFFYYLLLKEIDALKKLNQGTSINGIIRSDLEKYKVVIPSNTTQQKKISTILKTIDQTIESTQALIEKYQQIKAGLMHDLFTRGIGADGKLRPPREEAPELYQETAIGWIPKEWHVNNFGSCVEVIDPNPSHRYPPETDDGYPICSTENFSGEDDFAFEKSKFVPDWVFTSQNNRCRFKSTDIVFARKGKIGLARRYGYEKKVFSHTVVTMKPASNTLDADWLLWLCRSDWLLKGIEVNMNTNSGVPTLGVEFIKNIVVPFPAYTEQQSINIQLETISKRIQTTTDELGKLKKQKAGLMHDLLTGKVQVKVEEPTTGQHEHTHTPYAIINTTQKP